MLCAGDQVLSINGEDLTDVTHAHAIQLFRRARRDDITLTIRRTKKQMQQYYMDQLAIGGGGGTDLGTT